MTPRQEIARHLHQATKLALREIERQARQILREHPDLDEFVMAMGTWFFTYSHTIRGMSGFNSVDDAPYMRDLAHFIGDLDDYLRLTGYPMRFTAKGRKITDW